MVVILHWYLILGIIIGSIDSLIRSLITNPFPKDPAAHKQWFGEWAVNTFSAMVVWPAVLWHWYKAIKKRLKKDEEE